MNNPEEEALYATMRERFQAPQPPLSNDELRRFRAMLEDYERKAWLRKGIFTLAPWLIVVFTALGSAWQWFVIKK